METLQKLLALLAKSPTWCKIVVPLLCSMLAICYLFSSCGTTRAIIKTSADNTSSSISVITNNPTSVSVSNSIDSTKFNINPKKSK